MTIVIGCGCMGKMEMIDPDKIDWDKLDNTYKVLVEKKKLPKNTCQRCGGTGHEFSVGLVVQKCVDCKGTGKKDGNK